MITEDIAIDHAIALGYNRQPLKKVIFCSALIAARAPESSGRKSGITVETVLKVSSGVDLVMVVLRL